MGNHRNPRGIGRLGYDLRPGIIDKRPPQIAPTALPPPGAPRYGERRQRKKAMPPDGAHASCFLHGDRSATPPPNPKRMREENKIDGADESRKAACRTR